MIVLLSITHIAIVFLLQGNLFSGVCELPLMLNGLLSCMIRGDFYSGDELIGVTATWGSFCSVQCDSMFAPTGSASFFCQNNGRWQPSVPKCQGYFQFCF